MSFDPHYDSVSFLLHCDGADNGGIFEDVKGNTVTKTGAPKTVTAIKKIGSASAYLTTSDRLTVAKSSGLRIFGSVFTLEFFASCPMTAGTSYIMSTLSGSYFWLKINSTTTGSTVEVSINGTPVIASSAAKIPISGFSHIAVTRDPGGYIRLFIDGAVQGVTAGPVTTAITGTSLALSGNSTLIGAQANIYIDEFRLTDEVARYTSNFTAPSEPFPETSTPAPTYAFASANTPLAAPVVLAQTVVIASAQLPAILGAPALFAGSGHFAFAVAPSPIGHPSAVALAICGAYAQAPTPLAAPSVLAEAAPFAKIAVGTPLQQPKVLAVAPYFAHALAPSPMRAAKSLAWHDFTGQIGDTVTRYLMDLITPTGTVRVPISSWQATLRTGASSYVQCVIPAAQQWGSAINASTSFRIYRRAVTASGQIIEYLMAEAPADTPQFDRGPTNHTCTLSGYAPGFAAQDVSPGTDRTLTGIRSISSGSSYRVRCAVDWLLRPGQRGVVDEVPFVVAWINYYVSTSDAYMEAGT